MRKSKVPSLSRKNNITVQLRQPHFKCYSSHYATNKN